MHASDSRQTLDDRRGYGVPGIAVGGVRRERNEKETGYAIEISNLQAGATAVVLSASLSLSCWIS